MAALDIQPSASGLVYHERMTAYIASKGVAKLYADSLEAMLIAEPADPSEFLADHFASLTEGALKVDAVAEETAPKPEAGSNTALEAEIKRLKAEVERLQTVNTRVEAENKRLKAGQDSSTRFQDAVWEWAQHGSDIRYDIRLGAVACALTQIGPTIIELDEQKQEVDETRETLGRADPADVLTTTRLEWLLKHAENLADAAEKRSNAARSHYETTIRSTARSVVSCLAADRVRYAEALASVLKLPGEQEEFDNVMELFASLANTGELKPGDKAEAKLPNEARLRRVRVIEKTSSREALLQSLVEGESDGSAETRQSRPDADSYNVSVHNVVQVSNMKYEEGFETSDKKIVQVPRARLYVKEMAKVRQQLSQTSRDDWSRRKAGERAEQGLRRSSTDKRGRPLFQSSLALQNVSGVTADAGPPSKSLEFLMLLYADAERAVPELHALGAWVQKMIVGCDSAGDDDEFQVKVASLKGLHRAIEKCIQKYDVRRGTRALNLELDSPEPLSPTFLVPVTQGDFSRITDIARMTFVCKSCRTMRMALQALADSPEWDLRPVTNRLMPEYDADVQGGYRDMLLNIVSKATGLVAEVQVTLSSLLDVKASGGHSAYALSRRVLDRQQFEHRTWDAARLIPCLPFALSA